MRTLSDGSLPSQSQIHSRGPSVAEEPEQEEVFVNEFVSKQIATSQDGLVRTTDVARVYTGGTIGMKNHHTQGYTPAKGFLTETMKSMRRFNDPFAVLADHSLDSTAASVSWAETSPGTIHYQPVNLPLQYQYPSSSEAASAATLASPVRVEIEKVAVNGSNSDGPAVVINGTPVVRSRLPVLVTPRSLYGKRVKYSVLEYDPLMDSSNMTMKDWVKIATDIEVNYYLYDSFLVIHGTDTMAYTASALSFMLENLGKTVIITGSQVPLSEVRNDAVENLLGALTIAGHFVIPEVSLFFAQKLYRGNRSSKVDAYAFSAFDSPNMRPLAEVSINIGERKEKKKKKN
ncbi:hypothetical protein HK100_000933 [Physocladia obscura]|uniref:L-asparaginase N-terminal domain-containing protein n=1 Tax=Physocladia obscura TaxID=109957 RepID=A0AAD5SZ71_9FUNG|nr:hypothetical protein HK100_000933 [Physocladia obscura]